MGLARSSIDFAWRLPISLRLTGRRQACVVVAQETRVGPQERAGLERRRSTWLAWRADGGLLDRTESAAFLQKN